MKIALLTYFAADNYGAVLQTYATIKALEQQGHDVQIVNYVIPEPPRSLIKKILLFPKHLKLEKFRNQWFKHLTRSYKSILELQHDYPKADCYLVGSDQTWNPFISREMSRGFFLDFGGDNIFRATYAASFGMSEWEDSPWMSIEEARRMLKRFDLISVREYSAVSILREFGITDVAQVVDPVLLFPSYKELTGPLIQSDEIILYKIINSSTFYDKAKQIGVILQSPLRSIGSIRKIKGVRCAYPESLEKWMYKIATARYVVTDSFHGTVLSLLYGRQFIVCVGDPKRITRIHSLLAQLGLENRIFFDTSSVSMMVERLESHIDYDTIYKKLQNLRVGSLEFLKRLKEHS